MSGPRRSPRPLFSTSHHLSTIKQEQRGSPFTILLRNFEAQVTKTFRNSPEYRRSPIVIKDL